MSSENNPANPSSNPIGNPADNAQQDWMELGQQGEAGETLKAKKWTTQRRLVDDASYQGNIHTGTETAAGLDKSETLTGEALDYQSFGNEERYTQEDTGAERLSAKSKRESSAAGSRVSKEETSNLSGTYEERAEAESLVTSGGSDELVFEEHFDDLPSGRTSAPENKSTARVVQPTPIEAPPEAIVQENDNQEIETSSTSEPGTEENTQEPVITPETKPSPDPEPEPEIIIESSASAPLLNVTDSSGLEDTMIAIDISSQLTDTDGSESLTITISGVPEGAFLSAGVNLGNGEWQLTPAQLENLGLIPPANSDEDFSLTITATSTERHGGRQSSVSEIIDFSVEAVADAPALTAPAAQGDEDSAIALNINATLTDADGSESLSVITLTGLPEGATLSAGTEHSDGSWSLTGQELQGLTLTPPADSDEDFELKLSVTATDSNGSTATTTSVLPVTVAAVADSPVLKAAAARGEEDSAISLDISTGLTDIDGSETLSAITFTDVPDGAIFSAGTRNSDGSWTIQADQLEGLTITPPKDSDGDFTLNLVVEATDTDGATAATKAFLPVTVSAVADSPILEASKATGDEDTTIQLNITTALTDLDGSETLSAITISDVPDGAILSAGTNNHDGSWTITAEQLDNLTITPPENSADDFTLGLSVTATDTNGVTATTETRLPVTVVAVADAPLLEAVAARGEEDTAIALDISTSLTDLDGSEMLSSVIFTGVPAGAILSAGAHNRDGSWTVPPEELKNLRIIPPADSDQDFELGLSVTATDGEGVTRISTASLPVTVVASADTPTLEVADTKGLEDTVIDLDIKSALTDSDGSESLVVTISGVPKGAGLSAGTDNQDGTWTLTQDQLDGLQIKPPGNSDQGFKLDITSISSEARDGDTAEISATINVTLTAVADAPVLTASAAKGDEDTAIDLDIAATLTDLDGSEILSAITFNNIPKGATLSVGTDNGDGSWTVTAENLKGLQITPPADSDEDFILDLSITATDTNGVTSTTTVAMPVSVTAAADAPTFRASAATGDEDTAIQLDITASLTDLDGSETLSQITFSNVPDGAFLSAGTNNNDGTWSVDADDLAGLSITAPKDSDDDFEIGLSVTATDTDGVTATTETRLPVTVVAVADAPTLEVSAARGDEDTAIQLNITTALTDLDGSETLSAITISDVPDGAVLSAGTNNNNGTWSIEAADLAGLTITAPKNSDADFDLGISVTATDSGGLTSTTKTILPVTVVAVADTPNLAVSDAAGFEDRAIDLDIKSLLTDTDSSESQHIIIEGVPAGARLSAGTANDDGSWILTPDQIEGLQVTPPTDSDEDFSLSVTATSSEARDGDTASTSATIDVAVTAVADAPELTAKAAKGDEDQAIALDISAALTDLDGSEVLSQITFSNVPEGAVLSAGTKNSDGSWSVTAENLEGLQITPAADSNDDFTLNISVTATDTNGATATTNTPLSVTVTATADEALITGSGATLTEDTTISATGNLSISDADAGEDHFIADTYSTSHGSLEVTKDGSWTYRLSNDSDTVQQLAQDETITDTVTVSSADGTKHQLSFTINGSNDTPTVSEAVILPGGTEDTSLTFTAEQLLEKATDIDSTDTLHVANLAVDPSQGTLTDNGDGTFLFTPQADFNGNVTLSYDVTDGTEAVPATASLNIQAVNDRPEAMDDTSITDEDNTITIDVLGNDTDGDQDSLTLTNVSEAKDSQGNVVGTTDIIDNKIVFTPNDQLDSMAAGETQDIRFSYTVTDGHGGTDTATTVVTVSGTDNDLTYVSESAGYRNVVGIYEVDDQGQPVSGTVVIDDQNGMAGGTHLADLEPGNHEFFIIANGANEINEDSTISFDNSGDKPVLLIDGHPASHPVYYTEPGFNTDGKDHFHFEPDGEGGTFINIEDLPDLGDADFGDVVLHTDFAMDDRTAVGSLSDTDLSANTVEENARAGTETGITAHATDIDGDAVSYALSDDAGGLFTIDPVSGKVTVAEGAEIDFESSQSHTIRVEATSADGTRSSENHTISVQDVQENVAPDAVDDVSDIISFDLPEGGSILSTESETTIVKGAIVAEGETGSSVDKWTFHHGGGPLTIDTLSESGSNFTDIDGDGAKNHIDTMMRLYDEDNNHIAVNDDSSKQTGDGSTNDRYSHIQDSYIHINDLPPGNYTLAIGSWELTKDEVTNNHNDNYDQILNYNHSQDTGPYQISFTGDISFSGEHPLSTDEDTALTIDADTLLANDTDADGNSLTIVEVGLPMDNDGKVVGTTELVVEDGKQQVRFVPGEQFNALGNGESSAVNFSYTIDDGQGGTDTANVTVNVTGTNDAITQVTDTDTAENTIVENAADGTYTGVTLEATDADGDSVTYTIEDGMPFRIEDDGRVVVDGSNAIDFEAQDSYSFNVTATSADGTHSTMPVTINVSDQTIENISDLGGDENGTTVTFKITGDHYDPANVQDVGAGSPQYKIFINGEPFTDIEGNDTFSVTSNRGYVDDNNVLHRDANDYELVTLNVPEGTDIHAVSMQFINDAWDGSNDRDGDGVLHEDRNLVIDSINIGGELQSDGTVSGGTTYEAEDRDHTLYTTSAGSNVSGREVMPWSGTMTVFTDGVPDSVAEHENIITTIDNAENGVTATFKITGDHYDPDNVENIGAGSPQYQILIDGHPITDSEGNDTFAVEASRTVHLDDAPNVKILTGQFELVQFKVPDGVNPESVSIKFVNDAWDGGSNDVDGDGIIGEDRNLVVDSLNIGGELQDDGTFAGGTTLEAENMDYAAYTRSGGSDASGRETMAWNGELSFDLEAGGVPEDMFNEAPDAIDDGAIVTETVTINSDNMDATDNGFTVSAYDANGNDASLSTNQYGFGVAGSASGADTELGYKPGVGSEKIVVDLDDDVSSVDVSFGWKNPNEDAQVTFYKDGAEVGSVRHEGGTDRVDAAVTLQPADGSAFDQVVFSAPADGDHDYMINAISFTKVESEITTDEDTAITIDVLANDSDPDGNSLTITAVANPVDADGNVVGTTEIVTENGKQQVRFTPNEILDTLNDGEASNVTFSYTISDGLGGTDTATTAMRVKGVDNATVAPSLSMRISDPVISERESGFIADGLEGLFKVKNTSDDSTLFSDLSLNIPSLHLPGETDDSGQTVETQEVQTVAQSSPVQTDYPVPDFSDENSHPSLDPLADDDLAHSLPSGSLSNLFDGPTDDSAALRESSVNDTENPDTPNNTASTVTTEETTGTEAPVLETVSQEPQGETEEDSIDPESPAINDIEGDGILDLSTDALHIALDGDTADDAPEAAEETDEASSLDRFSATSQNAEKEEESSPLDNFSASSQSEETAEFSSLEEIDTLEDNTIDQVDDAGLNDSDAIQEDLSQEAEQIDQNSTG